MSKKDKFLAAAQKFLEKGSLDKALPEFQRAAQEDPKDTRTWLRIAEIHVKRSENSQATQVYLRTADLYVEQGFFQRAVAVYKNVIKLSPGHTDAHVKLAEIYKQLGLFSDAAQQYDHAATALQRAGKLKEAMGALAQIVEMHPDQVMARVKLAEVAAQAGQNEDALREWTRAAEQLETQGRVDDYLRVVERLLTLQPENYTLCKKAAVRYLERQNPRAALAKLQVCFNALPKDPETLSLLANAFAEVGQVPKTISVLKELVKVYEDTRQHSERAATIGRILALDPNDPIASQTPPATVQRPGASRSFALDDRSGLPASVPGGARRPAKRDAAITFSELAIPPTLAREPSGELGPPGEETLTEMTSLHDEKGAIDAQRIITEADIFVKYGLVERASEHLRRVFDIDPDHAGARERLAAILVQLGRKTEAVEELGLLAEQLTASDPQAAEKHLLRALDLDPSAAGARYMLDKLKGKSAPPAKPKAPVVSAADHDEEELDIDDLELEPLDLDNEAGSDMSAAPATAISDPSVMDGFKLDRGGAGATRATAPPVEAPLEEDEWGAAAQSTQIESFAGGLPGGGATAAAAGQTNVTQARQGAHQEAQSANEADDEFGSGSSTMFMPGLELDLDPGISGPVAEAPQASFRSGPDPSGVVLDDLDLGFEVGTPAPADGPLDPVVESDLEQVDFFLEQELSDEARSLLDDLPISAQDHPLVRERRARLTTLEERRGHATRMLPVSAATSSALYTGRGERAGDSPGQGAGGVKGGGAAAKGAGTGAGAGAGSMGAVPGGRVRDKSITPRAVVNNPGGADATTVRDLGIAYKEMGLYEAAIAEFVKLVDDPDHEVFALTMIGECYEARGTSAEALVHYKKALNRPTVKDEEATQLYYQLGRVFHAVGDQSEALYFFEKVYRRNPRFSDVAARVQTLRAQGVAPVDRGADNARLDAAGSRSRR
jgi:pilus assembly protein FimV